jgi:hypothetical protein
MSKEIVLDNEPEDDYAERTVATLEDNGCLVISHQFFSPDNQRWQSWQSSGSVVFPAGVARLKELLNEQ